MRRRAQRLVLAAATAASVALATAAPGWTASITLVDPSPAPGAQYSVPSTGISLTFAWTVSGGSDCLLTQRVARVYVTGPLFGGVERPVGQTLNELASAQAF